MLKVFNTRALTSNQRFSRALMVGIPAALGAAILYGIISPAIRFEFSVVYVGIGWGLGWLIQKYGRGVQPKFSILAAVLAALCFVLGDLISVVGVGILFQPLVLIQMLFLNLPAYLQTNASVLLGTAFRVLGVYMAYTNARIV
ncbi:MAG: hypothetical protein HGB31_01125 [Erysipelotrichaceae bacterium]|nr:hypothetical protein [Erysipelotrichaceae bacterium]